MSIVTVSIVFEGNLKDLLPKDPKEDRVGEEAVILKFSGRRSVKDLVQSMGVPHTEVGRIRVNGETLDFSYIPGDSDYIEVFPLAVPPVSFQTGNPSGEPPRFICDVHLRKLARRLRLLGFDTFFNPAWDDADLAEISQKEKRILLSRDRGLLMRNLVTQGLLIRNTDPEQQVKEVLQRLGIQQHIRPFTRCTICGIFLEPVSIDSSFFKDTVVPRVPPKVLEWCKEYHYCTSCQKVFWKGSHYRKLLEKVRGYR